MPNWPALFSRRIYRITRADIDLLEGEIAPDILSKRSQILQDSHVAKRLKTDPQLAAILGSYQDYLETKRKDPNLERTSERRRLYAQHAKAARSRKLF